MSGFGASMDNNSNAIMDETTRLINTASSRDRKTCGSWLCSKRWQLAFLMFFGSFFLYALRVNLSVAVVCMINGTSSNHSNNLAASQLEQPCSKHETFDWSESTRSNLLSAYFYGYLVLQLPGGWLAGKFGGTRLVSFAMLLSSVLTLLLPFAARESLVTFYAFRVVIGIFASVTYPAFQSMLGRWAPPEERTKLASFAFSGGYLGSIVTFSVSGVLCDHTFGGGWPSIFYVTGSLAFAWTLLWYALIYDSPRAHPGISNEEKVHIVSSLNEFSEKSPPVPWLSMLTSSAFWSLIVTIIAVAWVDYTLMTSLPQYMKDVLDFDIAQDGLMSSTPSICQLVSSLLSGPVADRMRKAGVSTGKVRKLFQSVTFLGISGCLLGIGYLNHTYRYLAVALLGTSGFFAGFQQAGYLANYIDIAPRFAGVMYGIGNCIATISGIASPIVVGHLTTGKSREEWQHVFYICVGICLVAGVVYDIFASGKVQSWAEDPLYHLFSPTPGPEEMPSVDDGWNVQDSEEDSDFKTI